MKYILALLLVLTSLHAWPDTLKELAHDREWLNYLHYQKGTFGSESSVDDPNFFISSKGVTDPQAELVATLEAIKKDPKTRCKYPARSKWLGLKLGFNQDLSSCQDYLKFYQDKFPKKIYLVFSSYYLESPASAFGHTLIRFSQQESNDHNKHNELMDTGINYGASLTTTNPFLYSILGLIGGFKGTFASVPYFYKIREYNDYESRDIWSYELKLTEEEKERMVDHLWEIGGSYFDYYFFTENCSQKMLALLDAANPSWELQENNPHFVVPADTLKTVANTPGLLGEITFRPSAKKIFLASYNELTKEEKESLDNMINRNAVGDLSQLSSKQAARVLDTLIYFLDYRYATEILKEEGEINKLKKAVLEKRSEFLVRGIIPNIEEKANEMPHRSHGSRRINLGYIAKKNGENLGLLSYRFSLHDINDSLIGSPISSTIEFFNFDFSYNTNNNNIKLESLRPVHVMTINPWTPYHYPVSFIASFDFTRDQEVLCKNCLSPTLKLAAGPSFTLSKNNFLSFWLDTNFAYNTHYQKNAFAPYAGASASMHWRFGDTLSTETKMGAGQYLLQNEYDWKIHEILRLHLKKDLSLGTTISQQRFERSLGLFAYYYY